MIPDSLLFQMSYLPLGFSPSDFLFAFFGSLTAVYVSLLFKKYLKSRKNSQKIPTLDDREFEAKVSQLLRGRIREKYIPRNASAHTVKEIGVYAPGHPYLSILDRLDTAIYRSASLTEKERKNILRKIG